MDNGCIKSIEHDAQEWFFIWNPSKHRYWCNFFRIDRGIIYSSP